MARAGKIDGRLKNLLAWIFLILLVSLIGSYGYSAVRGPVNTRDLREEAAEKARDHGSGKKEETDELMGRVRVRVSNLNLRSSPEQGRNRIRLLRRNTILTVHGRKNDWYEVETPDGTRGYVTADLKYVQVMEMSE